MEAYKVVTGMNCPKRGSDPVKFKTYSPGDTFIGTLDEANKPPLVRDAEGHAILMCNVYPDPSCSSPASSAPPTKLPADVQAALDKTVKKDFIGDIAQLSKGATTGAMIGAVVGIIVGLYYQKPLLVSGFAGLVIGGLIGRNSNKEKVAEKELVTEDSN